MMENEKKIALFFVLLSTQNANYFLSKLDPQKVEIIGVLTEETDFRVQVSPWEDAMVCSLANLDAFFSCSQENVYWVMYGFKSHIRDMTKMSDFLQAAGVRKEFIVNYIIRWDDFYLDNMLYVRQMSIDYFVTGISYAAIGLDLDCIPSYHGVNLAAISQDLYYSYRTAEYAVAHDLAKRIKFCLIGLAPYSFLYDMSRSFAAGPFSFQYAMIFQGFREEYAAASFFNSTLKESCFHSFSKMQLDSLGADLHYSKMRQSREQTLSLSSLLDFKDELRDVEGKYDRDALACNIRVMEKYLSMCRQREIRPIAVVLPFTKALRKAYPEDKLQLFRSLLLHFQVTMGLEVVDLFDVDLDYTHFLDLSHLNMKGARVVTRIVEKHLQAILGSNG